MRETWLKLDDGSVVDPIDCGPDESGRLVHKSGVAVTMRTPDTPYSVGVEVPDPLDHDGDGRKGGSKPRAASYKNREARAAR